MPQVYGRIFTDAALRHEQMRWSYMSSAQLLTRLDKVTTRPKLLAYIYMADQRLREGLPEYIPCLRAAVARYSLLFREDLAPHMEQYINRMIERGGSRTASARSFSQFPTGQVREQPHACSRSIPDPAFREAAKSLLKGEKPNKEPEPTGPPIRKLRID